MKGFEEINQERNLFLILLIGMCIMFFVMCGIAVNYAIKADTGISYTYTGQDYGNNGYTEQYFIRFIENNNGVLRQVELTASSSEEVGEIMRMLEGN